MWFDKRELVIRIMRVHHDDLFFGRSTQYFDDFNQLIDATFTREERLAQ
jgi:hypothetical protein